jgi:hypothetical protein
MRPATARPTARVAGQPKLRTDRVRLHQFARPPARTHGSSPALLPPPSSCPASPAHDDVPPSPRAREQPHRIPSTANATASGSQRQAHASSAASPGAPPAVRNPPTCLSQAPLLQTLTLAPGAGLSRCVPCSIQCSSRYPSALLRCLDSQFR